MDFEVTDRPLIRYLKRVRYRIEMRVKWNTAFDMHWTVHHFDN